MICYFENLPDFGSLEFEHSFLDFEDEEVLFTCHDISGKLCLCFQYEFRFKREWLIMPFDTEIVTSLINGEISMKSAFLKLAELNDGHFVYDRMELDGSRSSELINVNDPRLKTILPKDRVHFFGDKAEALEYLNDIYKFNETRINTDFYLAVKYHMSARHITFERPSLLIKPVSNIDDKRFKIVCSSEGLKNIKITSRDILEVDNSKEKKIDLNSSHSAFLKCAC